MKLAKTYHSLLDQFVHRIGVTDTVMHIHAGLAVMLIASLLSRQSLARPLPLIAVVVAELANEILDYLALGRVASDTPKDFVVTLAWPTILFVFMRSQPGSRAPFRKSRT